MSTMGRAEAVYWKHDRILSLLKKKRKAAFVYVYRPFFETMERINGMLHFERSFRMNPESFRVLCSTIKNSYLARFAKTTRAQQRAESKFQHAVAASLRLLAGGSYLDIQLLHGFSRAKLYSVMWDIVFAVDASLQLEPFFDSDAMKERAEYWGRRTNGIMGGCVGCLDGVFVEMKRPSVRNPLYYLSRKSKYGVNVQAICDHKYRFTWMSALAAGAGLCRIRSIAGPFQRGKSDSR